MHTYDFRILEPRWRDFWLKEKTFRALNPGDPGFSSDQPKFYVLDMFPYPSGAGLHVGHPLGYIATDIVARFKRMTGHNVLHPMGYDSFGLPAEQYAVETGTHPRVTTEKNIDTYRRQLQSLGLSVDWDRELATTDVEYYRWTQWIFVQLFESWYDEELDRARPVTELIAELESGARRVLLEGKPVHRNHPSFSEGRPWSELAASERRSAVDSQRWRRSKKCR